MAPRTSRKTSRHAVRTFMATFLPLCCLLISSCRSFNVLSTPKGAMVILDGNRTGKVTPAGFRLSSMSVGDHVLEVEMAGYRAVTKPQTLTVRKSLLKKLFFWFPPMIVRNVFTDGMKTCSPPEMFVLIESDKYPALEAKRALPADVPRAHKLRPLPPPPASPITIAVSELDPLGLPPTEVQTLSENLRSSLVNTRYFVVSSRGDMKRILKEAAFQQTDRCSDAQCLIDMGRILAVEKVIGGTIGKVGQTYNIALRMVDVETSKIDCSITKDVKGQADLLLPTIRNIAGELAATHAKETAE